MLIRMLLSIWLVPPALNVAIIATGFVVSRWYFRIGAIISLFGMLSLWLLSTPYVSSALHEAIDIYPAFDPKNTVESGAQAIIVAGTSHYSNALEYGGVASPTTDGLVRLHYTTYLNHQTGLPIMLTGGPMNMEQEIHSQVLANSLNKQFGIKAKWLEQKSATTWQNAIFSAEILHPVGITKVLLVTQSYHMRRAANLFEQAGFAVIPAPTQLGTRFEANDWRYWMPSNNALDLSSKIFHELIGIAWYKLVPPVGNRHEQDLRLYNQ